MRIGLISDIHANFDALEAVMRVIDAYDLDKLICLGDVVGYGAQPNECCELVRKVSDVVVVGNHDAAVCGRMDYSYYRLGARQALDWHAKQLTEENMEWLKTLPYIYKQDNLSFSHGSPLHLEDFGYIFVLEQMRELCENVVSMPKVVFIGHSHLCKCFSYNHERADEVLNTRFLLKPDLRYVITAGSVGQPRDYDPRACFGIYDTEEEHFQYVRVRYDIESAVRKILATECSPGFGKRLYLGV